MNTPIFYLLWLNTNLPVWFQVAFSRSVNVHFLLQSNYAGRSYIVFVPKHLLLNSQPPFWIQISCRRSVRLYSGFKLIAAELSTKLLKLKGLLPNLSNLILKSKRLLPGRSNPVLKPKQLLTGLKPTYLIQNHK